MNLSNRKLLVKTHKNLNIALIYIFLAIAAIIAFEPVRHNDFVSYDDETYVTENPHVKGGLTRQSVIWAFTTARDGNWFPLTWLSHMTDCTLFGLNPAGHHFTSLLLHIASSLLLFGIFNRMTGKIWASAFVAAAFALHPLRVQSVAWAAERKDVLSVFWAMLAMAAYVRYAEKPSIGKYLLTLLALCLGLMAKPMLVTLPFVFLLLDYWPMRRVQWPAERNTNESSPSSVARTYRASSPARLIAEKIPFFLAITISCLITYRVQQIAWSEASLENLPVNARIINALTSYLGYIIKIFYPSGLAVLYPYPKHLHIDAALLLPVGIAILAIRYARQRPWLTFGLLWFFGTLVPVIGLLQVGMQAMADRYTYLPSIGVSIIVAWGAAELLPNWRYRRVALAIMAGAVLAALFICTRLQLRYWKNSVTLYKHTLAVTKDNLLIHNNLADALLRDNKADEAMLHLEEALRINPKFNLAHYNLGRAFLMKKKLDEAAASFDEALELQPDHPYSNYNRGVVMTRQGNPEDAIGYFKTALQLKGDWPEAYSNLGLAYALTGKYDLAIQNCNEALRLKPDFPAAINNLNMALQRQGKTSQPVIKH
jgi:tetratricopeptide (TPR) repeat protein